MNATGLAAHLRREAEQKRHEARAAVDRDDFAEAADLRKEADDLLARADGVNLSWPLQPLAVAS